MSIIVKDIVNKLITSAIDNIVYSSFYLIKYSSIKKKFTSDKILYKNIISDFNPDIHKLSDILRNTLINLNNILPIPIINGKYYNKDLYIKELPSQLLIVSVDMNILKVDFNNFENLPTMIMDYLNSTNNFINIINTNSTENLSNIPPGSFPVAANHFTEITPFLSANPTELITNLGESLYGPPHSPVPPSSSNSPEPIPNVTDLTPPNITLPPTQPILNQTTLIYNQVPSNPTSINILNISEYKEKYKDDIKIMIDMGFTNEHNVIESLIVSDGIINNAIHYYLQL